MVFDHSCSSVMANTGCSEGLHITRSTGEVLVGIHYKAEQLSNLTIIDYMKDILTRSTDNGVRMKRWEANRFFERNIISVFAEGDVRRDIMLQETRCPVLWDFWDDRYDPKIRQSRIASQDPELFRILERDETTANGVSTIMSDGHDEILVLDVGYLNLRNVLYVDVVQVIHDFNSFKSVSEDKMRRIWENIIHSMNHYESEELKAEKLEEMDSQEAKRYWHDFGLKMLVKPSHEQASSMDGHSYCGTYAQSVQQMSLFTRPLPPPPGFEGNLPHLPRASINRDQDTTTRRPSCPQPDNRPISPVPPLTQTAQPFSMFTISLPQPATLPAPCTQRSKRNNQPTPPRPTFSQTAQPISLFTVLLPRQGNRPLSFTPTPSSSQAALPPLILSRPSWPPVSLQEQVLESVSAETSPTPFPRLRTHRRLWDPPSARDGFTLRTRRGDLRVPRED